ncbi:hypothetical protein [Nocardia sp. NPDC059228]|uniref:hypothetical protein n=1 Tax=Nocardia sp. NPDC059228 TaxID=3346777 RepID=UPI0036A6D041
MNEHSHGSSFDRVVDALRQVTTEAANKSGEWTKFRCPAHDDHDPSLGVKYDPQREKTIVVCFARCPQEDVLAAANLRVRDLFDHLPDRTGQYRPRGDQRHRPTTATSREQRPQPHRPDRDLGAVVGPKRWVADYDYTSATNDPVGRVIRYKVRYERGEGKTFSQRRWDADRHMWVPGGFDPVLYRAPIVAWAIANRHPIVVCEGEKDVDRAIDAGYPATCNAGGAGKFRIEHAEQLRGAAHIAIVADRDRPGFEHAAQVYSRLHESVGHIDVLYAATGKDLSDHLDAGHDINDLHAISPDQLVPYLRGLHDHGQSAGTSGQAAASAIRHPERVRPELDWGLDR